LIAVNIIFATSDILFICWKMLILYLVIYFQLQWLHRMEYMRSLSDWSGIWQTPS